MLRSLKVVFAGGITVGAFVGGMQAKAEDNPPVAEVHKKEQCSEEEKAAIHQYLLEQGLLEMEAILTDSCSDFNVMEGNNYRVEPN